MRHVCGLAYDRARQPLITSFVETVFLHRESAIYRFLTRWRRISTTHALQALRVSLIWFDIIVLCRVDGLFTIIEHRGHLNGW